jgi:hypothetical protein
MAILLIFCRVVASGRRYWSEAVVDAGAVVNADEVVLIFNYNM